MENRADSIELKNVLSGKDFLFGFFLFGVERNELEAVCAEHALIVNGQTVNLGPIIDVDRTVVGGLPGDYDHLMGLAIIVQRMDEILHRPNMGFWIEFPADGRKADVLFFVLEAIVPVKRNFRKGRKRKKYGDEGERNYPHALILKKTASFCI